MPGGVINGQAVSAEVTNPAFIIKNADDVTVNGVGFQSVLASRGGFINDTQREFNAIDSFIGQTPNQVYNNVPSYTNNQVGSAGDPLRTRVDALSGKFDNTTGHLHTGASGDAPPIPGSSVSPVQLHGYFVLGLAVNGVTGTSTDVSTQMSLKSPSSGPTVQGVVVGTPYNRTILKYGSGPNFDDDITDGSGNIVYGRITESLGVWTLSYYVLIGTVETAYSFATATDLRWFFQELFNPLTNAPVYNEQAFIPSEAMQLVTPTRSDSVACAASILTKTVTFSAAMPSANYGVSAQFSNTVDSDPSYIPITITAKTTSGFTATWNTALDSANYVLEYLVIEHV